MTKQRRGISIRWLLLAVGALILLFPVFALLGLQIYQNHLVRRTEHTLITQSVITGELWRNEWLKNRGVVQNDTLDIRPADQAQERYIPIEPVIDISRGVAPSMPDPLRAAAPVDNPAWMAGREIMPALRRAQVFNLSSANVLDPKGCVMATTGAWVGACFDHLSEVKAALGGEYAATARERVSDEPKPPLHSISRQGDVRVFTATPIFEDGRVVAVVWMSRTSMAPFKVAWLYRRPLLFGLTLSVVLAGLISLFMAWAITRPLRKITEAAGKIAQGGRGKLQAPPGFAPAEVHILSDALRTMTGQLSDRAEYIAEFAANASHELKSPITAIHGAAELLSEELDEMPQEQRRRFLQNIEADAGRMEQIVTRLLQLARIDNTPESFREIDTVPYLESIAGDFGDKVHLEYDLTTPHFEANPEQLESALRNLLDNGLRHGAGAKVALRALFDETQVHLSVIDQGPGVSDANRSRIFERFFTTERDRGGTGLGLAIVQAVAKAHGGSVSLETSPKGSTFTISLPRAR